MHCVRGSLMLPVVAAHVSALSGAGAHAGGLLTRFLLQGPFPETFPLLPDLVILQMDHNRFKCAPCFLLAFGKQLAHCVRMSSRGELQTQQSRVIMHILTVQGSWCLM